jgi:predicted HicB family RNase H-like nuclease
MLVVTRIPTHRNDGSTGVTSMSKRSIESRARELLTRAREVAETSGVTWVEANNAIYGLGGLFARLFPNAKDRVAFAKTKESRQVDRLIDSLPEPPVGPQLREYSGKFNVRVPKSLHAALASEAEAEGVSLNQLVVAKLALHLQGR